MQEIYIKKYRKVKQDRRIFKLTAILFFKRSCDRGSVFQTLSVTKKVEGGRGEIQNKTKIKGKQESEKKKKKKE